jgi:hypothetical protein
MPLADVASYVDTTVPCAYSWASSRHAVLALSGDPTAGATLPLPFPQFSDFRLRPSVSNSPRNAHAVVTPVLTVMTRTPGIARTAGFFAA